MTKRKERKEIEMGRGERCEWRGQIKKREEQEKEKWGAERRRGEGGGGDIWKREKLKKKEDV